jgi:hypothetical protein
MAKAVAFHLEVNMRHHLTLFFAAAIMLPIMYWLLLLYMHALEALHAIIH